MSSLTCFDGLTWFCLPLETVLRVGEGAAVIALALVLARWIVALFR